MITFDNTTTPAPPTFEAVEEEHDRNTEYLPKFQSLALLLSLFNTITLLSLGVVFTIFPRKALSLFLDNSLDPFYRNDHPELYDVFQQKLEQHHELIENTARLAGGLLLSQALTSILLSYPILHILECSLCHLPTTRCNRMTVMNLRVSIALQAITGLVWILVGLLNDSSSNNHNNDPLDPRAEFGLFSVGFLILLISSFGLMLSYWPAVSETTARNEHSAAPVDPIEQGQQTDDERPSNPLTEPLLTRISRGNLIDADQHERKSETRQTNDEAQQQGSLDNVTMVEEDAEGAMEATSRIRGTRRLLSLAAPQVVYLYIGCITLLIRLPFSLAIPHFVSTTLGALSRAEFNAARKEVCWLFILGTIDAW
jgi:hypothetical protein